MRSSYITPDDLANRLEGVRRSGSGFTARCPIHDDRINSLKVSAGRKATLLYCHAGCRPQEILSIFGWSIQETFYDYRPEGGHRDGWSVDLALKQMVASQQPVNVWEPYTLADVMRGTFHATDLDARAERMAYVGSRWGSLLLRPFDPDFEQTYVDDEGYEYTVVGAFRIWHIVADGPVFDYLEPWVTTTKRDWREVKPRAMQAMWTYWKRETGEGVPYRD